MSIDDQIIHSLSIRAERWNRCIIGAKVWIQNQRYTVTSRNVYSVNAIGDVPNYDAIGNDGVSPFKQKRFTVFQNDMDFVTVE